MKKEYTMGEMKKNLNITEEEVLDMVEVEEDQPEERPVLRVIKGGKVD